MKMKHDQFDALQPGTHEFAASGRVVLLTSCNAAISVEVIDSDGIAFPYAAIPSGTYRTFYGPFPPGYMMRLTCNAEFLVKQNQSRMGEEPNSGIPAVEYTPPPEPSRQQIQERTVMQVLQTLGVMPTNDQVDQLERKLGFRFDEDGEDWGQGFMEELEEQLYDTSPEPQIEPLTGETADPVVTPTEAE